MKKRFLFTMVCAIALGGFVSSCSNDSEEVNSKVPEIIRKYTDVVSEINGETGIIYKDYQDGNPYIDAADGNRYYLFDDNERPQDGLTTLEKLEKVGVMEERNVVKFSGKVYGADERWIIALQKNVEEYGWCEYARLYQIQLELPTIGHTFCLVAPYFTIEQAE